MNTEPIIVTLRPPKWVGGSTPDCEWRAKIEGQKIMGRSLCCRDSAIKNVALHWFFGGNTRAKLRGSGLDPKTARERLLIKRLKPLRYEVRLKEAAR